MLKAHQGEQYLRRKISDTLMSLKRIRELSLFHLIGCSHNGIHEITLDEKDCVKSMKMNSGGTEIADVVKLTKTNATHVDKVMTAEFALGESDGSICASKIFDSDS